MTKFLKCLACGCYAIGGISLFGALLGLKSFAVSFEEYAWVVYGVAIAAILFAVGAGIDVKAKRVAAKYPKASL